jgi:hypothetical protein
MLRPPLLIFPENSAVLPVTTHIIYPGGYIVNLIHTIDSPCDYQDALHWLFFAVIGQSDRQFHYCQWRRSHGRKGNQVFHLYMGCFVVFTMSMMWGIAMALTTAPIWLIVFHRFLAKIR